MFGKSQKNSDRDFRINSLINSDKTFNINYWKNHKKIMGHPGETTITGSNLGRNYKGNSVMNFRCNPCNREKLREELDEKWWGIL